MSTPLMTLKMAVFAPMPSARVTSAMAVNVGAIPKRRKTWCSVLMQNNTLKSASRTQKYLIGAQSFQRIDSRSPSRGQVTGQCSRRDQDCRDTCVGQRIERFDPE